MGRPASAELYFLIADFLARSTPCQRAAAALREELVGHSDTPTHVGVCATVPDMRRLRRVPEARLP
jgi:hypothetical protein